MFFASLTCLYLHKIFAANRLMLPFISRRDINWPNLSICACSALKSKTNNSIGFFVLQKVATQKPCLWNGMKRPCYLFARKFYPEALDNLIHLFSNYTVIWFIHTVWDLPSDDTFFTSVPHENRCRLWSSNSFGTNLDIEATEDCWNSWDDSELCFWAGGWKWLLLLVHYTLWMSPLYSVFSWVLCFEGKFCRLHSTPYKSKVFDSFV